MTSVRRWSQAQAHVVLGASHERMRRYTSGSCSRSHSSFAAASPAAALADALLDLLRLLACAPVGPEDRRAQRAVVGAERHQAVHLARQPDGQRRGAAQLVEHLGGRPPPFVGVLLGLAAPRIDSA